jgi:2-dehydro-3-deoxyphosphogluconate aldolase/(4S)-4-hydroxy-2-oxoglutarate aldolase
VRRGSTLRRWDVAGAIAEQRLLGIVRSGRPEEAARTVDVLADSGLTVLEVSLTTPGALDVVRDALRRHPNLLIGAGTVLDEASARLAVLAGAQFLVSPSLHPDVLRTAHRYGLVALPGATTPTEVVTCLELGADLVKLFPASSYGPLAVADLLQALPQTPLVPTGGVTPANAEDYVRAGAVAVGMGGSLSEGSPEEVGDRVQALLRALQDAAR